MIHPGFANDQFSVPGNSGDYTWGPESNSWTLTSITTYTYNETGKLLKEVVQDAETYLYLTRELQAHESKGNTTEEILYIMSESQIIIKDTLKPSFEWILPVSDIAFMHDTAKAEANRRVDGYAIKHATIKAGITANFTTA